MKSQFKPAGENAVWTQMNEEAMVTIGLALDDSQLLHVMLIETVKFFPHFFQEYVLFDGKMLIRSTLYMTHWYRTVVT